MLKESEYIFSVIHNLSYKRVNKNNIGQCPHSPHPTHHPPRRPDYGQIWARDRAAKFAYIWQFCLGAGYTFPSSSTLAPSFYPLPRTLFLPSPSTSPMSFPSRPLSHPPIHPWIHPHMYIHASIHGLSSIYLSTHTFMHTSMHPCILPGFHPSIHPSIWICMDAWIEGKMDAWMDVYEGIDACLVGGMDGCLDTIG